MSGRDTARDGIFRLEGGLLPADLLNQLDALQLPGQKPADYRIPKGLQLRDEIGRYWRIGQALWSGFEGQMARKDRGDQSQLAQQCVTDLLVQVFGFDSLEECGQPQILGEREFPITHQASDGAVPLALCAPGERALDTPHARFGQAGRRRSPTGLLQEYLNAQDGALWGLVSDGQRLRILRDNPSMTRPAYVEIDLATLFNEERLPDFRRLWLLLHASRFKPRERDGKRAPRACWLEQWREQAEEQGERLLDKLRLGVTEALQALGNGFLGHPGNDDLRRGLAEGRLDDQTYYQELLRLVYRLLFLLRAEARGLLHAPDSDELARDRYRDGYSLDMLRQAARRPSRFEPRHHDLWLTLGQSFRGLAGGQPLLALPALGGLFETDQCPNLDGARVDNRALLTAIRALTWHRSETNRGLVATDYANMDAEELGSVYEALLELVPAVSQTPWRFRFIGLDDGDSTAGNLRKLTGSYYTPDVLVQSLIDTALKPVIEQRLADNREQPRKALLEIRVVDPACGSGHFLLAATRTLARELARLDAGDSEPTPEQYQHALREVVQHCIHGVDLNPMAVELCRAALWMEALEPGRPLTFLESRIQCGNALVGVFDPDVLEDGIPADAFKALDGDDKELLKELRKENKEQGKNIAIDLRINTADLVAIEQLPEDSLDDVQTKRLLWEDSQQSDETRRARLLQDLWTAAFFIPKNEAHRDKVVTNAALKAANRGELSPEIANEVSGRAEQNHFFHWRLQFPEVFDRDRSGFDVVLGNPPWEVSQLSEEEFFAARDPDIANKSGDRRKQAIAALKYENQRLFQLYQETKYALASINRFYRGSGRFPTTAHGKLNLYPLFSELALRLYNSDGRAGIIVQRGIATDDSNKLFFQKIISDKRLVTLLDIENSQGLFKSVHRSFTFCLLTLGNQIDKAELLFYAANESDIADPDRRIHLAAADFLRINPNTLTTPTFRASMDAEITRRIYERIPVFVREADPAQNPWGVTFKQGLFNMTSASHLFKSGQDLSTAGGVLHGNVFHVGEKRFLPLYEAKMVHHFDHRFATFDAAGENIRDSDLVEKKNPDYEPLPRCWVDEWEVVLRTADAPRDLINAIRKEDHKKLNTAVRTWLAGQLLVRGDSDRAASLLAPTQSAGNSGGGLFESADAAEQEQTAKALAEQHQMSDTDLEEWLQVVPETGSFRRPVTSLLRGRCPTYLLGIRGITRATDERSAIASSFPLSAVGNSLPVLLLSKGIKVRAVAALQANLSSLVLDFVARLKIGGSNLNFFIIKQFPLLPPEHYNEQSLDFIAERTLELVYTSHEMRDFARDLGHEGPPFPWDPDRRHQLRCELDACYAHIYGLTRDELRYILDPADVMGPDYPSVTFPGLKRKEIAEFGEYRTQRRVLEAFEQLAPKFAQQEDNLT